MDTNQNAQEPSRQENQQRQQAIDTPISFVTSVLHQLGLDREQSSADSSFHEPLAALNDRDWRVRVSAIRTLERWGTRAPMAVLVQALEDEDSAVRAAAVHALGMLGEQAPVERLLAALQDSDWHVRETAVLALGNLGAHVPEKSLVLALKDSDSMVREAAQLVLHRRHNVVISAVEQEKERNVYEPQTTYSILMEDSYPLEAHADKYGQVSHMDTLRQLERHKKGFLRSHWAILTTCAVLLIAAVNVSGWMVFVVSSHSSVSNVVVQAMPTVTSYGPAVTATPMPPPISSVLGTPVASIPAGQTIYTYHGQSSFISAIAWSPDGSRIASANADNTLADNSLEVWYAFNGKRIFKWSDPYQRTIAAVAWSPDGRYIAVGGPDSNSASIYILDATTGQIISTGYIGSVTPQTSVAHNGALQVTSGGGGTVLYALVWAPDSRRIAVAVDNGPIRLLNAMTGADLGTPGSWAGVNASANTVSWSSDGQYIVYGMGSQLMLWNITNGQLQVHVPARANETIISVAWSPDNQNIAIGVIPSGGGSAGTEIWDPFTGQVTIYANRFVSKWSPDGKSIVGIVDTGGSQNVQIWDAMNGKVLFTYVEKAGQVSSVAWSPDGNFIASGDLSNEVNVWRAP